MSTIGSSYNFVTLSTFNNSKQSASETRFDSSPKQAEEAVGPKGSEHLSELMTDLKDLKQQQVHMSPREYLSASLTLKEQISSERIKAGEQLDVFDVQFEGQIFQLAGKIYGPETLNAIKDLSFGEQDQFRMQHSVDIKS
ncbi:hypothetical protein SAMN04515647_3409 [Cohaesibacter sp. ES.047]|uniref:hypothetical protein n=1 Tax=Cohaesibacter sp. ES.047 TaxID=1798205 RepID=UPI000BB78971|nr:hypothetical protein [Cohaesibacter sp. ES.047]SNY93130.1 hypothetical protein SAMN04515647_3409 [Cohaesibacter sp. ES.047]